VAAQPESTSDAAHQIDRAHFAAVNDKYAASMRAGRAGAPVAGVTVTAGRLAAAASPRSRHASACAA
jgi:hypothetical protein